MDKLPHATEAASQARAVAEAPKYIEPRVVDLILMAIDAGKMSVVVNVTKHHDYTVEALRNRGYTVEPHRLGLTDYGLKVSWGLASDELAKAYWEK